MNTAEILIVEDNRHDVAMIQEAFSERNIKEKVRVLGNGAEVLDYFFGSEGCLSHNSQFPCPKFIMLDLKLPKVSGLEVLRRLKADERTKNIPVIVFTSSNEAKDRSECYLSGANSYIVKPLDADCFSQFVADIKTYWFMMNRTCYNDG
ncbi:MAG: response regulator [Syntrophales bacterium]